MLNKILKISITTVVATFLVIGCGSSSNDGGGGNGTGTDNGNGNNGNNNGNGNVAGPVITGQSGDFGDKGSADNSVRGTYSVCPANVVSFFSFGENGDNWCVPGCTASANGFLNDDGDEWGSYLGDSGDRYTCFITPNPPGSQVQIYFSAAVDGCPAPNGCAPNTFPPVFVTANAGDEMAGSYSCSDWRFDVDTQDWSEQSSPAPISLTLNAGDGSATINGTPTTWSFANGVLRLEGNRTFNNVAVGSGSFTEYHSNVYITRCK